MVSARRLDPECRDTYLRYGVELAFLAEQAYEFEADKRIDVIRFDYDVSDLGDMLAGDFLLRDLDTLEQDLIVSQRMRQQQVRYVLSLAREFPEALQELRDTGRDDRSACASSSSSAGSPVCSTCASRRSRCCRVALMDATRFSLELTHLGSGQVRLKAQPGSRSTAPAGDRLADRARRAVVDPAADHRAGDRRLLRDRRGRTPTAPASWPPTSADAFEGLGGRQRVARRPVR